MDASGCVAWWRAGFGAVVYIARGSCSVGQIVIAASTNMSPRRQAARRIVESSDDESLPETWEEMQRNIEPVSPAVAPEQRQEVITIEDDAAPEPSFEVILSMSEPAPPEPAPPEPAPPEPAPPEPAPPEPAPPEPAPPEPAPPEPAPQEPAPDSPQPGPSGIQEINDDGTIDDERLEEQYFKGLDDSVGTILDDNKDYASFQRVVEMTSEGIQMVTVMMEHVRDTVNDLHTFKEAYRSSRRACKRKLEEYGELEVSCKKFKDQVDVHRHREQEASKSLQGAIEANEMLHRQIATVESECRNYMEQRDQAEAAVDQLKGKLTQEKTKTYNVKTYTAALKGAMEDKDKTIGRLEAELAQTRQRLHQFTRISVPRRSAAAQEESSSSSSDDEN